MSQYNIYKHFKLKALDSTLDPDDGYIYRKICRWYSTNFATPLHKVYKLPVQQILINYYEASLEKVKHNDVIDIAIEDFFPQMLEQQEQDDEAFLKALEEEQAIALARLQASNISKISHNKPPISHNKPLEKKEDDIELEFDMDEP